MIKKFLFGLLAFVGLGLSFSSAGEVRFVGTFQDSAYDNNYNIQVIKKGSFLTQLLGTTKNVLVLRDQDFFIWDENGDIYIHSRINGRGGGTIYEGYPSDYFVCDQFTGFSSVPSNCSVVNIVSGDDTQIDIYRNFLKNVTSADYYYYNIYENYGGATSVQVYQISLCISSVSAGKSICWAGSYHTSSWSCQPFGGVCPALVRSQGLGNVSFGQLDGYPSPAVDGSIDGSSNTSVNVSLSGNVVYNSCTNGYVLNQIDKLNFLDESVCYAGLLNTGLVIDDVMLSNTGVESLFVPGNGIDFKTLFSLTNNGQSFNNWYNSNLDTIWRYKLGQLNGNPFLSERAVLYSYFYNLYRLGYTAGTPDGFGSSYDILNYCKLKLFSDYNSEYKGNYFKSYCNNLSVNNGGGFISTGEVGTIDDDEVLPPGFDDGGDNSVTNSGTIISIDWSGTLSGDTNQNFDGKNFINSFYQKFQSQFKKPINNVTGIVPGYILVFLFAVILFKFLRK